MPARVDPETAGQQEERPVSGRNPRFVSVLIRLFPMCCSTTLTFLGPLLVFLNFSPVPGLAATRTSADEVGQVQGRTDEQSDEPKSAHASERNLIRKLVLITFEGGCSAWPSRTDSFLASNRDQLLGGEVGYFVHDSSDLAGRLFRARYKASAPVLLVFDREDELVGALGKSISLVGLTDNLLKLNKGIGTVSDLKRRASQNPEDTRSLWELAGMQEHCRLLGDSKATIQRIRDVDPKGATEGGEAVHINEIFEALFNAAGSLDPTEVDFEPLTRAANELRTSWARTRSFMAIADLAQGIGPLATVHESLASAWESCPADLAPSLAVWIRENPSWPTYELSSKEPWPAIDEAATKAGAWLKGLLAHSE